MSSANISEMNTLVGWLGASGTLPLIFDPPLLGKRMPLASIFEHQLHSGETTRDVDAVVVAAKLEFVVKEEILHLAMRLDRDGK
jgi:hypothetical protein